MEIHGKAVASIESTDDDKFGPNGGFTAVLSTPSVDRDGDRLFREEWLDLPEWLPLDIDHGMSMADTIGKFHPYWEDDRMMMDAYFASTPRAQETRQLLNDLKDEASDTWPVGVSVAFMTDKSKKDGEPRRELLNAGVVAIPSNRDAKILASKEMITPNDELLEEKAPEGHWCQSTECGCEDGMGNAVEVDSVEDEVETKAPAGTGDGAALTQAIHDASVHLGAVCYPIAPEPEDPTGASSGANKTVTFDTTDGDRIAFATIEEAKAFFEDMLKSIEENPTLVAVFQEKEISSPGIDLEAIKPEGMTQEQFESALKKLLTPVSPEEPAPADEAAAASPADDWARKTALMRMRVRTRL